MIDNRASLEGFTRVAIVGREECATTRIVRYTPVEYFKGQLMPTPSESFMTTFKFFAAALALFGLLSIPGAQAVEPRGEDPGALEHYHHEYYSHSSVDPNDHDGQESTPGGKISKSKKGGSPGKSNVAATIALGGHRRHHQPQ